MAKSEKRKIGDIGENIACRFLKKQGFKIIEQNYWKKWGEIDIIAQKKLSWGNWLLHPQTRENKTEKDKIYFVEVKTIVCENNWRNIEQVMENYLVSDKVHYRKLQRLARVFRTYLLEKRISDKTEWQFDIIIVFLNLKDKVSRVKWLKDIII